MSEKSGYSSFCRRWCQHSLHRFSLSEFTWHSLGFYHSRPNDFTLSQWLLIKPWAFTIYRVVLAVGLIGWVAVDMTAEIHDYFGNRTYIWFVYATNWAFGMATLVFFILAVYCLVYNCPQRQGTTYVLYQPIWLFYTIATNLMILTSLVFWVMLPDKHIGVFDSLLARLKHSLVAAVVLIDTVISAIPFRLVHVVYPVLTGIAYSLFSYVYWLARGPGSLAVGQVYPGLNWTYPRTAILACLCVLIVVFFVHILLYLIQYVRVTISASLGGRGYAISVPASEGGHRELEPRDYQMEDDLLSTITTDSGGRSRSSYGGIE